MLKISHRDLSNKIVVEIEISLKEKDIEYMKLLFFILHG